MYIKKRIKPYQFKSKNLIESNPKVKQVYENFNKEYESLISLATALGVEWDNDESADKKEFFTTENLSIIL